MTFLSCTVGCTVDFGKINGSVHWIVNDGKFLARTIFFSHTKLTSSNNPRSYTIVSASAEQSEYRLTWPHMPGATMPGFEGKNQEQSREQLVQ